MQRAPGYESITPRELKEKLDAGDLPDRFTELDPAAETIVICHHGARSAYATRALGRAGFRKVLNLEGGLDAYADLDPSVPRY